MHQGIQFMCSRLPGGRKELEGSSVCPLKILKKKSQIPKEAGSSGSGKTKGKTSPLPPDHTDDEKE